MWYVNSRCDLVRCYNLTLVDLLEKSAEVNVPESSNGMHIANDLRLKIYIEYNYFEVTKKRKRRRKLITDSGKLKHTT